MLGMLLDLIPVKAKVSEKVNICHRTESNTNRWNALRVDEFGWNGHDRHHCDFLYKGSVKHDGQPSGDAWCYDHEPEGCGVVSTPTPTSKPDPTPTKEPEPTPTSEPEPTPEITPIPHEDALTVPSGPFYAPTCPDGSTILLPANPHVFRAGEAATVKWWPTEADQVNLYYKEVGQANWTHAVGDLPNDGSYTIHGLNPTLGYVFGIQQKHGCGGGETVVAVIVDGPTARLFPFSYWMWQ